MKEKEQLAIDLYNKNLKKKYFDNLFYNYIDLKYDEKIVFLFIFRTNILFQNI